MVLCYLPKRQAWVPATTSDHYPTVLAIGFILTNASANSSLKPSPSAYASEKCRPRDGSLQWHKTTPARAHYPRLRSARTLAQIQFRPGGRLEIRIKPDFAHFLSAPRTVIVPPTATATRPVAHTSLKLHD